MQNHDGERIAKYLARVGVGSRRDVERFIAAGRIRLNGKILTTPAVKVTDRDKILFDENPVGEPEPPRLWRYHKPTGLITAHKDPEGRPTVFDALPKSLPRVMSIGRLDMNSEGLLLLTNDGELKRQLELPSTGWSRKYRARAYGHITQERLDSLQEGIMVDGVPTGPIEAVLERQKGDNVWVQVMIREGKNREVRRALETLDLQVNRLIRVSYGPFQLSGLARGAVESVKARVLKDQVGHLIDIPEPKPQAKSRKNKSNKFRPGTHTPRPANSRPDNKPSSRAKPHPSKPSHTKSSRPKANGPKRT